MSAFALTACSDCGRIFESNSAYNVHSKVCKPDSTKKITYVCSYCEAAYETKAMFSEHVNGCPLKPSIPEKGNANACKKCLEVFDDENAYNNHTRFAVMFTLAANAARNIPQHLSEMHISLFATLLMMRLLSRLTL